MIVSGNNVIGVQPNSNGCDNLDRIVTDLCCIGAFIHLGALYLYFTRLVREIYGLKLVNIEDLNLCGNLVGSLD